VELHYYVRSDGRSPFQDWFAALEVGARARVATAIVRLGQGNTSNVESIGGGVFEYRVHSGPGYRVYFGRDGTALIILLSGGTKNRQQRDIEAAHKMWRDYKLRKRTSF